MSEEFNNAYSRMQMQDIFRASETNPRLSVALEKQARGINEKKWIPCFHGYHEGNYEISVAREDFHHGFISFGWFEKDRKIEIASGRETHKLAWDRLIALAHEVADDLNAIEVNQVLIAV